MSLSTNSVLRPRGLASGAGLPDLGEPRPCASHPRPPGILGVDPVNSRWVDLNCWRGRIVFEVPVLFA